MGSTDWTCIPSFFSLLISFLFIFYLEGDHKDGEWTMNAWEISTINVHNMKFQNNQLKYYAKAK